MTTQESFKHRIRERMSKTGERYGAARRALLARAETRTARPGRSWVVDPGQSDERIRENTGRSWDEWADLIDAGPGRTAGHTAIATWLRDEHGVDAWWAQSVTVGYERITGLRLPGQMPDGTFTVSRSRTVDADGETLRAMLLDETDRRGLFPGRTMTLRSKPSAKSLRFGTTDAESGTGDGVVAFAIDPAGARTRVTVSHEKLPSPAAGEVWKEYWTDWLVELADAARGL